MYNFPKYLIFLLWSYLGDRKFFVFLNNVISSLQRFHAGVPQGSVLGPLIFIIFLNNAPKINQVEESIFADDELMFTSFFRIFAIVKRLQQVLKVNRKYFGKLKIKINMKKTEVILFTKRKPNIDNNIHFDNVTSGWSNKIKYLCVILDKKLIFGDHINCL